MERRKIKVAFYQRKARKVGNYSVEFIFNDVRSRLSQSIDARTYFSTFESSGFFKRLFNCLEALFRQKTINHVTGDINYIGLLLSPKRTVHTILDCVFITSNSGVKQKILKFFWLTVPVKRSKYVTAISQATKDQIVHYSKCDPSKVIVIPVAISENFQKHPKEFSSSPVILQIGTAPNKNVPQLINAIEGFDCVLHIVGQYDQGLVDLMQAKGVLYKYESNLSQNEMLLAYKNCDIVSLISTYEGFGMPILEGQATGRVVITSNISSMPEVAGDAACFVNPFDANSIRAGFNRLFEQKDFREELIQNGFLNVQRFDPNRIANQYFSIYQKMISNS